MGVVYKVDHAILRKPLAVKVLRVDASLGESAVARFEQEAKAASVLSHTNLVHVQDFGVTKTGSPYLVMDYCEGSSIAELVRKEGVFTIERAMPVLIQICSGIAYMHAKGIIHRDIKPSNIVVTKDERGLPIAKLLDFGLAKFLPTVNATMHTLTQTGEVFGSPQYMSPEQCLGETLDERSDVYSLGCVMYEMLTGQPPHTADNAAVLVYKHVNDTPVAPTELNKLIPAPISAIIMRALSRDLKVRYSSIDDLKQDLTRVAEGGEPEPPPESEVEVAAGKRKRLKVGITIGAAVIVFGLLVYSGVQYLSRPPVWKANLDQAKEEMQKGDFGMAEISYKEALALAKHDKPADRAKIQVGLADVLKREGEKNKVKFDEAARAYTEALPLLDPSDHVTIARANEGLGDCLHAQKQYDDADLYFANAVDYRQETEATDPYALAAVLMKQGRNFRDNMKFDKAEPVTHRAVTILQKLPFVQQAYMPQCLSALAQIAQHRRQNDRANALKEAARIHEKISGSEDAGYEHMIEKRNQLIEQAFSDGH